MSNKYTVNQTDLIDIADAIREETETSDLIQWPQGYKDAIHTIKGEHRDASDLTASGATVSVPAGFYKEDASKTVTTAEQATPSITVSSSGLVTASVDQAEGYVSAGTKSATKQMTTQAAKTITPSTSEQTAVATGVYTTGDVKVAAMPRGTAQSNITLTASDTRKVVVGRNDVDEIGGYWTVTNSDGQFRLCSAIPTSGYYEAAGDIIGVPIATQGAQTIIPSTYNQTISSGRYLTGTQTIAGDSNLIAGNIKSGVTIFGITGLHDGFQLTVVGGTTRPSSPKERTLWINTSVPLTTWRMSSGVPTSLQNGLAWIQTNDTNGFPINVAEYYEALVNIARCSVYNDGIWTDVQFGYYINGNWTLVDPELTIFEAGRGAVLPYTEYEMSSKGTVNVSTDKINIVCTGNSSSDFTYYTTNPFDKVDYTTLSVTVTFGSYLVGKDYSGCGLTKNKPVNGTAGKQTWAAYQDFSSGSANATQTYNIPIGSLSGTHYFCVAGYGMSVDVTDVRLKR